MIGQIAAKRPKYYLEEETGEFIIENYNFSKPLANFFPGIAGKYGIPMWVFYVNRGQAISSLGVKDKDHSILEFFPANKAWQLTSLQGFRTFIKTSQGGKNIFYEPFHNGFTNLGFKLKNQMRISPHELNIEEENLSLGLKTNVEYFTIPCEPYAGLARIVTVKNTSRVNKNIELLDGLPQIVPFGTSNLFLKKLGRTIEAWMTVQNLEKNVPLYKLDVDPTDRPEVVHIKEGNFYIGFHYNRNKVDILKPIVDPECIFGSVSDFSCPYQFISLNKFSLPKEEITRSKTPCGFSLLKFRLDHGEEKTFYSIIGYITSKGALNASIGRITQKGYIQEKRKENEKIIKRLQQDISTQSSSSHFNLYAGQTYLDNIIRGGYPVVFKTEGENSVFYLYSRKHGDLERDYNKFQLQPAYFSQGNGNYRDINQNRRSDVWFNPEIRDENVITFFNLIQADGFNPLVVKGINFSLKDTGRLKEALKNICADSDIEKIITFLNKPFTPGSIILFLEENKIKVKSDYDSFLNMILSHCLKNQEAEHGEGFWTDHWTYNLDLLEGYLGVYPEKLKDILFDKAVFSFYDNPEVVRPRNEKYILWSSAVRQLHSLILDPDKKELILKRKEKPHLVRRDCGKGEIYYTTLSNKILCIIANKLSSLDPCGVGIEMEANKPNWFDALNGLPALFGSSLCETLELKRLLGFIIEAINKTKIRNISITKEIYDLLDNLTELMRNYLSSDSQDKDYTYWDKSYTLKEEYRKQTKFGFTGEEKQVPADELLKILGLAIKKLDCGIEKAWDAKTKIYYSYFINEVTAYEELAPGVIKPKQFNQKKLPFFLEAQVHAFKLNNKKSKILYAGIKNSQLYDKKLGMYKVTAPLAKMPEEIGRCRAFTPGWLENESIWLHMEYKYLLEILKAGLYNEFYGDFKKTLIAFQDPQQYGRSILENSSFLVSSAFPDEKLHGNGFVARLSGSTAEFINIWLIMNLGLRPFFLDESRKLNLKFSPILAGWLFKKDGTYSFNFLKEIAVTYHNPNKKDTFNLKIKNIRFDDKNGKPIEIISDTIPTPYAEQIRSCLIKKIDIYF